MADELPELHQQRVVQPVLLPDRPQRFGIAVLTGQRQRGIARERSHSEEHHDRCQQQGDERLPEAAE